MTPGTATVYFQVPVADGFGCFHQHREVRQILIGQQASLSLVELGNLPCDVALVNQIAGCAEALDRALRLPSRGLCSASSHALERIGQVGVARTVGLPAQAPRRAGTWTRLWHRCRWQDPGAPCETVRPPASRPGPVPGRVARSPRRSWFPTGPRHSARHPVPAGVTVRGRPSGMSPSWVVDEVPNGWRPWASDPGR